MPAAESVTIQVCEVLSVRNMMAAEKMRWQCLGGEILCQFREVFYFYSVCREKLMPFVLRIP